LAAVAGAQVSQTTIQPVTSINYLVNSSQANFDNLGIIDMFAGNFTPGGENEADGASLPIAQNSELYAQVGTIYGGNGTTNFDLPDLDGRIPIGTGQGAGLTNRVLGEQVGADSVTLTKANLPTSVGGSAVPINNVQPSLALNYVIATQGIFPSQGMGDSGGDAQPYVGQVFLTASPNVSSNLPAFASASGQTLSVSQNMALSSILGQTYGGNGATTFQLPNVNGQTVIGAGSGAGLTPRSIGETLGTETTTLTTANLPAPNGVDQPYNNMQPSLTLHYIIATQGVFPSPDIGNFDNDQPIIGQISLFASNFAPGGWDFCDGQILSINQNPSLYSVIGDYYGGNGTTTFALPDLQGRVGFGFDDGGAGLDGLEGLQLGDEAGTETLQLTASELPTVPEPASLGIMLMGAIFLARRRAQSAAPQVL